MDTVFSNFIFGELLRISRFMGLIFRKFPEFMDILFRNFCVCISVISII